MVSSANFFGFGSDWFGLTPLFMLLTAKSGNFILALHYRFYSDRGVCAPCEGNCKTCYGPRPDQCASCLNGSFLLKTSCHGSCPPSYYPEGTECLPCYQNCLTCKGMESGKRVLQMFFLIHEVWLSAFVLQKGMFLICRDSNNNNDDDDVFISGSGLYDCTSCHDFFTLDGGMCIECPSGRYYNVSSQACEPCNDSCLTCSSGGENGCTSCQAPKSLHLSTSTCRECCPAGVLEEDSDSSCCSCDPATGEHCSITAFPPHQHSHIHGFSLWPPYVRLSNPLLTLSINSFSSSSSVTSVLASLCCPLPNSTVTSLILICMPVIHKWSLFSSESEGYE